MMKKREMKVMCVQETKMRGERATEDGGGIQYATQAVNREAETKDGGRKRWRRQLKRSGEQGR